MREEYKADEFDLQLRSLLEDAEVKAPGRVWRAVSSRLDAALAPAVPAAGAVRWGWVAGLGMAFAAALVAGIFLVGTRDAGSPAADTLVAEAILPTEATVPTETESPVGTGAPASTRTATRTSVREAEAPTSRTVPAVPADSADSTESTAPSIPAASSAPAAPSAPAPEETDANVQTGPSAATLLAQLANEDELNKTKSGISIQLDGAVGGNDSRLTSGMDRRAYMSSGSSSHTKTSIAENSTSTYDIPLSFGLGIRFPLTQRFSVGTGVMYSILGRTFTGEYFEVDDSGVSRHLTGDIRHSMSYIGVPINAYYDLVSGRKVDFYAYGGGTAEYCISNRYSINDVVFKDPVDNLQFSIGAGFGVQFKVSDHLGIYVDPGVRYYFRCDQPKSVRTDKPLMVNFEAGLRFNL